MQVCRNEKSTALSQLEQAQNLYENAQFGFARQMLDELKKQYPKELNIQIKVLRLMREIELSEQKRNILYSDSMLIILQAKINSMKPYFTFIKDSQYDNTGRYINKKYISAIDNNGSHIKIDINEWGDMALISVYSGRSSIKHNRLKVITSSGEYAETESIPFDGCANYSFQNNGIMHETVTYQKGKDNGVIRFIYHYSNEKLTMEYCGEKKTISIPIGNKAKTAMVETVDFALLLTEINQFKKEKKKAEKRIEYLQTQLWKQEEQ